jgi:hypothetical protein
MSELESINWGCCGDVFEVQIWKSINRQLSPGKIEEFAQGKLNQIVCPKCGDSLLYPLPVLFHDMDKEIMVLAGDILDDELVLDAEDSDLEDSLSAMLQVEDPIVAARVLIALDTSELPREIRARDPALSGRDVNAEAFRLLYQALAE